MRPQEAAMNETIRARSLVILRLNLLVIAIGIVLGGLAAPIWHSMVTLPTYTVGSDGAASTTEKGLTQVFSTDAVYCFIGLVVGLIIGCLSWVLMRRWGAWGVLAAGISACLSALACWWVGVLIGPDSFAERIASAKSGEVVPVDFALHTWVAVLVWLLAAMVPLLIASLLTARRGAPRTGRAQASTEASLD
ncbi:hypothetical protein E5345_04505 [Propionibacterium sp. NM47_B9-13]|nr:hypothetical protein BCB70_02345 [Cutibacterium modestum]EFS75496.1 hypothetical protein HMPREF9621_00341 [Cutibacterium modestum HL037PA2]EFS91167.1 hypothetical protein HMPREF9607_02457 [Cutibacterium modestum HL044PA1]EFT16531.1 hypothetical protein HMPREF9622_00361 [Cutibacterium modestum HL037PA3]TGY29290.1 hypothetical protein E5345_04505 [Propionibacterium sp. NM47_B9-13]